MPGFEAAASLLVLGVLCTGAAFVIFYSLVASDGPARASLVGYIAPGFSVVYGVTLLDESFTLATAAGLVPITGGSWLAAEGRLALGGPLSARCTASWPQAAAISRPRVSRTVVRTPRSSRAARNAAIASRPEPP